MEKKIIGRGLLAGLIGGIVAFLFARVFVEPAIGAAIAFEEAHSAAGHEDMPAMARHDHAASVELFTRGVQANVGMGFGMVAFAIAMGALLAVAFVVAYGRAVRTGPTTVTLWLAGSAFGSLALVPSLKYPPNPPSVGQPESLSDRTGLYLLMVALSVALTIGAVWLGRRLLARFGGWSATLIAAAGYVLAITVVMLALPDVAETPEGFPADVLYDFRVYSLGTQLVMWMTIAVVFASTTSLLLGERSSRGRATTSQGAA